MKNLNELTLVELIRMYDIVLHNRGILGDEFYVADLIRQNIIDRLMPEAMKFKAEQEK